MSKILSVNKRCYPVQNYLSPVPYEYIRGMGPDKITSIETTTVLVAGEIGDYAAYTGHGTPEWVAEMGDKISFAEACVHFGGLDREKYRN